MLEWLIIGGGIHGTYLSNLLVHEVGVPPEDVRVLDPHPAPLALWQRHAAACGMTYLRSPSTHNLDLPVLSLYRFAMSTSDGRPDFIPRYNRPSLELFARHCRFTIEARGLDALRLSGRARVLHRQGGGLSVETEAERLSARRVLLAIGLTEQPRWPRWARRLQDRGAPVDHVFAEGFQRSAGDSTRRTIVVGGGLSAVQTALALVKEGKGAVCVLCRHRLREIPFDFDPCWIGPKCMRGFLRISPEKRRPVIDNARLPGTVPAEVRAAFESGLADSRRLRFEKGGVDRASISSGEIHLHIDGGRTLPANRVILATGFDAGRPGGRFVDNAVKRLALPVARCGYPLVGDDLQWGAGLFVTGPLAELRVGPCARNISGARNAGRLLLGFLKPEPQAGQRKFATETEWCAVGSGAPDRRRGRS